jgi:hypothetical protein
MSTSSGKAGNNIVVAVADLENPGRRLVKHGCVLCRYNGIKKRTRFEKDIYFNNLKKHLPMRTKPVQMWAIATGDTL